MYYCCRRKTKDLSSCNDGFEKIEFKKSDNFLGNFIVRLPGMWNSTKICEIFSQLLRHILINDMPRLTVLVSGCSVFLVAGWLLLANQEAGRPRVPVQLSGVTERRPDAAVKNGRHLEPAASANRDLFNSRGAGGLRLNSRGIPAPPPKRKQAARGISVDRSHIIETVTMDDLRAPEGRLWIPAAVSGPIDLKASNPIFNVLVAYCQLDMVSYHESPWLFAMGTFHQRTSGCLDDKSLVRTFRLSSLKVSSPRYSCCAVPVRPAVELGGISRLVCKCVVPKVIKCDCAP